MVLDSYRKNVDPLVTLLAKPFLRFNPNTLTLLSLLFAIIGAILYYLDFLLLSSIAILFSALFDALDGKVARIRGVASRRGDFLDHLTDRYSDAALIFGIGVSKYCDARIALIAIIGVFLTSYVGTQAQAVGIGRIYGGIVGRAERMIVLIILPILQFLFKDRPVFTITEYVMLFFGVGGLSTSIYRAVIVWKALKSS